WNNPETFKDNIQVQTAAIVGSIKTHLDKKGELMAFVTLEDRINSFEAVVFSSVYGKYGHLLGEGEMVFVIGKVTNASENSFKLLCDEIFPLEEVRNRLAGSLKIIINPQDFSNKQVDSLHNLIREHPGNIPLFFEFRSNGNGETILVQSRKFKVLLSDEFIKQIQAIVGKNSIIIGN
ncbi:MAG: OB-fold nucleic acid binding domain-containing protein, partial [Calditrichia bacterium]